MQYGTTVRVRYIGASNTRPSKFSAQVLTGGMDTESSKPLTASFDYSKTVTEQQHELAKTALTRHNGSLAISDAVAYGDLNSSDRIFIF